MTIAIRERDMMRGQVDKMRQHLEEATKRAVYLEGQVSGLEEELRRWNASGGIGWWVRRVGLLEEAFKAGGDELNDSKMSHR